MNYDSADDVSKCFEAAYAAIRERIARGGPPWRGQVQCMCEACVGWYGAMVMEQEGKGRGEIQAREQLELNALISGLERGSNHSQDLTHNKEKTHVEG